MLSKADPKLAAKSHEKPPTLVRKSKSPARRVWKPELVSNASSELAMQIKNQETLIQDKYSAIAGLGTRRKHALQFATSTELLQQKLKKEQDEAMGERGDLQRQRGNALAKSIRSQKIGIAKERRNNCDT